MAIAANTDGTTSSSDTGATSATLTKPAGTTSGDLLVLAVMTNYGNTQSFNNLTGWTKYTSIVVDQGYSPALAVYVRVADGSEGASFSPTWGTSAIHRAVCERYSGTGIAVAVTPSGRTESDFDTAWSSAGITVGGSGSDWVILALCTEGSNVINGPSGYTERAYTANGVNTNPLGLYDSNGGVAAGALTLSGTNHQGKQEASLIFTLTESAGGGPVIPVFMNQYRQRWNRSQPFERRKSGLYAPLNSHQRIVRAA